MCLSVSCTRNTAHLLCLVTFLDVFFGWTHCPTSRLSDYSRAIRSPGEALCPGALSTDDVLEARDMGAHPSIKSSCPPTQFLLHLMLKSAPNTDGLCTISYTPAELQISDFDLLPTRALILISDRSLIPDRRSGGDSGGGREKEGKRPGGVRVYGAHA
ncbi:hypothetical protein DFH08DRAFT_320074 [Mycena albidolilacea]|uniref:Uncharacterized protein n=1 Tax=Mycena albidolilacea TaxID=1033008 RepID=A0AAD6ZM39_9AGAR|nr:hypothetical protein DFH08DRAFT_320074 [Mycena albidolilacea]